MLKLTTHLSSIARHLHLRLSSSVLCRRIQTFQRPRCVLAISCFRHKQFSTFDRPICDIQDPTQRQNFLTNLTQKRFRRRKGKSSRDDNEDEQEEHDDDDEALANENPLLVDDLLGAVNDGSQEIIIDVNSLRLDALCKTGFAMTRAKVEETFYSGDIYVNGERAVKKSQDLSLNDEVDIIRHTDAENANLVHIKRLVIMALPDKATEQGRFKLKIKRWQDLTVEAPSQRGRI